MVFDRGVSNVRPTSLPFGLRLARMLALFFGPLLVVGETVRRWHQFDQPEKWPAIVDDYMIGGALILSAIWLTRDPSRGRAAFAAAWGLSIGLGFGSVVGHYRVLHEPDISGIPNTIVFPALLAMWLGAIVMLVITVTARWMSER